MKTNALCFAALTFFLALPCWMNAQQEDVPEPVFLNFSVQPPYVPTYHGRDPFKPLNWVVNQPQISIAELKYYGIVDVGSQPIALFGWRADPSKEYTLKNRKLYNDAGLPVDGVVGDITDSQVILIQGDQKIAYSRK